MESRKYSSKILLVAKIEKGFKNYFQIKLVHYKSKLEILLFGAIYFIHGSPH
jgi:hypothetical protein